MTDEAKQKRREYYRKYYLENKRKFKKWQASYWERKAKETQSDSDPGTDHPKES